MATLFIDLDHHVGSEVDDLLEVLGGHVEQVTEAAGHTLEVPDVRNRSGQLDVTHALATHGGLGNLHATALTHDALKAHTLVLTARALPVARGAEDLLAEKAVLLGLEGAVVDGFRLLNLTERPTTNVVCRSETNAELFETSCVEHVYSFPLTLSEFSRLDLVD